MAKLCLRFSHFLQWKFAAYLIFFAKGGWKHNQINPFKQLTKIFDILPKWRNFAESSHPWSWVGKIAAVCTFHSAAPGSNPKHTIFANLIDWCNWYYYLTLNLPWNCENEQWQLVTYKIWLTLTKLSKCDLKMGHSRPHLMFFSNIFTE